MQREGGGIQRREGGGGSTGEGAVGIFGDLQSQVIVDQVGDVDPCHEDRRPRLRSGVRDRDLQLVDVPPAQPAQGRARSTASMNESSESMVT